MICWWADRASLDLAPVSAVRKHIPAVSTCCETELSGGSSSTYIFRIYKLSCAGHHAQVHHAKYSLYLFFVSIAFTFGFHYRIDNNNVLIYVRPRAIPPLHRLAATWAWVRVLAGERSGDAHEASNAITQCVAHGTHKINEIHYNFSITRFHSRARH